MSSDDLTFHLKLDNITINADDDSAIVKDINGNEIDGSVYGNPKVVDDELFGKCLLFDGDSYLNIPNASALHHADGFTVSVWAKIMDIADIPDITITENPSYPHPLAFTATSLDSPRREGYNVYAENNDTWVSGFGGKLPDIDWDKIDGLTPVTGSWTNLTIIYDSTASKKLYLYINGQNNEEEDTTEFHSVSDTDKEMRIGASATMIDPNTMGYYTVNYFVGKIADLRIYNRALSESEVWDMLLSSMKIENAEDITNRINNLSNDDLISLLTTMRQDKDLLEEIEYLGDEQREEIASALKEYGLDDNWKSMMEIFNIN